MQEVWRRPSAQVLADLKECLDFGTAAWIGLFARLGGADLLLQVCCYRNEMWLRSAHPTIAILRDMQMSCCSILAAYSASCL